MTEFDIRCHLQIEERSGPAEDTPSCQPFDPAAARTLHGLRAALAREEGTWEQFLPAEPTAYALSQITAAHILPPLVSLACGSDLLNYRVGLRSVLGGPLLDELEGVLREHWCELGWGQVGPRSYLCVIGAGVAACIDAEPGDEQLYLRYDNDLANALFHAGRTIDLPRSRLFLQQTLYEKFDVPLALMRARVWNWLHD